MGRLGGPGKEWPLPSCLLFHLEPWWREIPPLVAGSLAQTHSSFTRIKPLRGLRVSFTPFP